MLYVKHARFLMFVVVYVSTTWSEMISASLFVYCVFVNCSVNVLEFLRKMIVSLQLMLPRLGLNYIRRKYDVIISVVLS